MAKGSAFERDVSRRLSLWWTHGERDDVLWRSDTSGARATTRKKGGKDTANAHGDLAARHPCAFPLLRFFTFELKRGYNRSTIQDLLDEPEGAAVQTYDGWFDKAHRTAKHAGSVSWCVIVRRDRREPLALFPRKVFNWLSLKGGWRDGPLSPCVELTRRLTDSIVGTTLAALLAAVTPDNVLAALEAYDGKPGKAV
jgi:hypothetical protein